MLSCPPKLSTSRLHLNSMPQTVMPHFAYVSEHTTYSTCGAFLVKYISPCIRLSLSGSFEGPYSCRAVHKDVLESCKGQAKLDLLEEPNLTEKIQNNSRRYILESVDTEEDKKIQRRRKTAHGNKGKRPWNKGLKHSEGTREIISRRTKEALRDPKVRKKMSEAPRTLSNLTKARISASLTKIWGKRLKWKRSREKFMQSWAQSIAKAAKIGGTDQQELDWDSYENFKREIALQQIRLAEEKQKAKMMKRIQAERAAQAKVEKMAMLAQKRRERELRGESVRKRNKKSKEEKEKLAESQELKLKERLMKVPIVVPEEKLVCGKQNEDLTAQNKISPVCCSDFEQRMLNLGTVDNIFEIHKKKSAINQVSNQHQRPGVKLELDFTKMEQLQKEVSLADQIRFAKKRREQPLDKH